jgi:hypothetical protein
MHYQTSITYEQGCQNFFVLKYQKSEINIPTHTKIYQSFLKTQRIYHFKIFHTTASQNKAKLQIFVWKYTIWPMRVGTEI